jgi:CheY-like chemotaxis protein
MFVIIASVSHRGRPGIRQDVVALQFLLIALTGWGQEHDQRRSRAAGFDHHLVKPPDFDKLRDLLSAGWPGAEMGHIPDRRRSG